jgi:hypothetical protein
MYSIVMQLLNKYLANHREGPRDGLYFLDEDILVAVKDDYRFINIDDNWL